MKSLPIVWQRLVNRQGNTCPRCHGTGDEVMTAVEKLRKTLLPLGIEPQLVSREIHEDDFMKEPAESNRIWIAGLPLETWLEGQAGSSQCCDACGENECRTLELAGQQFEIIPSGLIVKAGMMAASRLLDPTLADSMPISNPET